MSEIINPQNSSDCSPNCWCKMKNEEKVGFIVGDFNQNPQKPVEHIACMVCP